MHVSSSVLPAYSPQITWFTTVSPAPYPVSFTPEDLTNPILNLQWVLTKAC